MKVKQEFARCEGCHRTLRAELDGEWLHYPDCWYCSECMGETQSQKNVKIFTLAELERSERE